MRVRESSPSRVALSEVPGAFQAIALGVLAAGVALAPHAGGWLGAGTPWAARAAGAVTVLAGLAACVVTARRAPRSTAVFDRARGTYALTTHTLRGVRHAGGPLGDVADVQVGEGRDSENHPVYRVTLVLASGARLPLSPDHRYAEAEARRAADAVRALLGLPPLPPPPAQPAAGAPEPWWRRALTAAVALPFVCLFVAGLLIPFAGVALGGYGVALDLARRATYRPVPAEVLDAEVRPRTARGRRSWMPQVTYRYQIAGRTYTSDRLRTVGGPDAWTRGWAEGVVRRYAPGRPATAYASPTDPSRVFLDRGVPAAPYLTLLMAGTVAGVLVWIVRRGAPKARPEAADAGAPA